MKRYLALCVAFLMTVMALAGCNSKKSEKESDVESNIVVEEDAVIRVAALKGPTSMGMVKLIEDGKKGELPFTVDFTMATAADEINPDILKGNIDIASVPVNLASVLYSKAQSVQVVAVNTLGVLYIVEKGEAITSVADLKGKTIMATGKDSTPEYTLRFILQKNGLDPDKDVTIEWKSEPTEIVSAMEGADNAVAMMPQPFVTVAMGKVEGLSIALDLTKEWGEIDGAGQLVTSVIIVNKKFAEEKPELVQAFMSAYADSQAFVNADPAAAAVLIEECGIVAAPVAEKAIPFCNITCVDGSQMKKIVGAFLEVLYDMNPAAVGGSLPDEEFYY